MGTHHTMGRNTHVEQAYTSYFVSKLLGNRSLALFALESEEAEYFSHVCNVFLANFFQSMEAIQVGQHMQAAANLAEEVERPATDTATIHILDTVAGTVMFLDFQLAQ